MAFFFKDDQVIYVHADINRNTWIVSIKEGFMKGLKIQSLVKEIRPDRIEVTVRFYAPLKKAYLYLMSPVLWLSYIKIYKEDGDMMIERQSQIDLFKKRLKNVENSKTIGSLLDVERSLPYAFQFSGHNYCIDEIDGKLKAYDVTCPHLLKDLSKIKVKDGMITCPWHDYSFSIDSGCEKSGKDFSLWDAPEIKVKQGLVVAYK